MRSARRLGALACALTLWTWTDGARAEVSVLDDGQGRFRGVLVMYREGSPPADVWKKIRPVDDALVLNASGDSYGDGMPEIAIEAGTGLPQVVWAAGGGGSAEILLARWEAGGWMSPTLEGGAPGQASPDGGVLAAGAPFHRASALRLSPSPGPWFAPRAASGPNGLTHVVWSGGGSVPSVWYRSFSATAGVLGDAISVSDAGLPTRDPSILVQPDFEKIFIGVEQEESGLKLVVIIEANDDGFTLQRDSEPFRRRIITLSLSVRGLQLQVRGGEGAAWATWVEEPGLTGMSDYLPEIDNWSTPFYLDTTSPGSLGR
jgi:hypothetical protein